MRVIAGEFRSRKLQSSAGLETRPTPDRLRETLFNVLQPSIGGAVFLDAFAGTGSVGIEALSRGARHAIFIEKSKAAVAVIQANLAALRIEARARVIQAPAAVSLAKEHADIVFLDPPYVAEREYGACIESLEVNPPPLTVIQHSIRLALAEEYARLHRSRVIRQGDNALSFYTQK